MYEKVSLILGSRLHIKGLKWMKSDSLKGVFKFLFHLSENQYEKGFLKWYFQT